MHNYGKAKFGIFFKRYFDFKNIGAQQRFKKGKKHKPCFPIDTSKYYLDFEDNFDSLNTGIWQKGQPWGRFHRQFPHQYYGDTEVFVKNSILNLQNRYAPRVFNNNDSNYSVPYGTGLINTYWSKNYTTGYFSIRSKNPSGPATWPAFWLTGHYNWPPEIDIFEMYGHCDGKDINEQTMTLHFGKIENRTKLSLTKSAKLFVPTDTTFHEYSCLWEKGKVTFFTDGVRLKTIKMNKWMRQFYNEPMYIVLNNAVDHRYLKCIDNRNLPSTFQVDWIRVYKKKN